MPAKNVELYIEECITSILEQSYKNWELIAIDDNSTDNTFNILTAFSKKDNRIQVYKNINTGIINALRFAYDKSSGNYITRMDSDDIMFSNKLEVLLNKLLHHGKGHISTGKVKYFSAEKLGEGFKNYQNWLNNLTETGINFSDIYKECVIPSPNWMINKSDLEKCNAFKPNIYPEDYDLCFRFYQENLKVIPCNILTHKWRDYTNRTSRNDNNYSDNTFLSLKCNYFIKLDYNTNKELIVWGTGKKGKKIAKQLIENNLEFRWITNNINKIGHNIYNIIIENANDINFLKNSQFIIAVANKTEQLEIKEHLINNEDVYFFC